MKVTVGLQVPDEAEVSVVISASIRELLALNKQLDGRSWSKTGELLSAAIRNATAQLRSNVEQVIEQTPENT